MPSRNIISKTEATIKFIRDVIENPVYAAAVSIHRTHKNNRLDIPEGSFLYDIYRDKSRIMVVCKATQCGISEYLIVRAIRRASDGKIILYVLPTFELKNQYVRERFDKVMLFTPTYKSQSRDAKKMAESMSLKQFNTGTIAFVGSNTPNAFISFPADDVIIDELDNCNQDNLAMAEERQSRSKDKTTIKVGNPTIVNFGIDAELKQSDGKIWHIRHSCGEWIVPDFFAHVVKKLNDDSYCIIDRQYDPESEKDIRCICPKCGKPYDRFSLGEWVKTRESDVSGYSISKMFSTNNTVRELLARFEKGLTSERYMERFYNGDLGLAYSPRGATIDWAMLNDCRADYALGGPSGNPCVAGIDVGSQNHILIAEVMPDEKLKVVYIGSVSDEAEIFYLIRSYNVVSFVIDALPETRMSKRLCTSTGRGFMCYFTGNKKDISFVPKTRAINVNRTMTLDAVKENILLGNFILPANADKLPGFYEQMTSSTRVLNEKRQVFDWLCPGGNDHFFLASGYLFLAKRILIAAQR